MSRLSCSLLFRTLILHLILCTFCTVTRPLYISQMSNSKRKEKRFPIFLMYTLRSFQLNEGGVEPLSSYLLMQVDVTDEKTTVNQ